MWCPYCGCEKDVSTSEHVFTRALGANVEPTNPFLLDVCGGCNTACGKWIDGPFVKSWLIYNARARSGALAYDPTAAVPFSLPLCAMGRLVEWPEADEVCDFWLGPTGDHVFHFHRPYPNDPPLVGRPPHERRENLDPGVVFVSLVGSNPDWHPIVMQSVRDGFKGSPIHYLNAAPPGQSPPYPAVPAARKPHADWADARSRSGSPFQARVKMDAFVGERFSIKLALGFGARVLGDAFARSPSANLLRRALWERDRDARATHEVRGVGMFDDSTKLAPVLGWNGCHVILAKPVDGVLTLTTMFYSWLETTIQVTDDPAHWEDCIDPDGSVWVIAPGLRQCVGPMALSRYLAALRDPAIEPSFFSLAQRIAGAPKLPPFHPPT